MAIPRPGGDRTRLTGRLTPPFDRGLSRLLDEWEFDRRCGRCRGVSGPNGTVSPRHRRRPAIHAFCRSAPPEKLVDGRPSPPMIQSFRRARHARGRDLGCRRPGRPQPSGSPSWRYSEPVGGCRKVRLKSWSAGMASWSSPAKQGLAATALVGSRQVRGSRAAGSTCVDPPAAGSEYPPDRAQLVRYVGERRPEVVWILVVEEDV